MRTLHDNLPGCDLPVKAEILLTYKQASKSLEAIEYILQQTSKEVRLLAYTGSHCRPILEYADTKPDNDDDH